MSQQIYTIQHVATIIGARGQHLVEPTAGIDTLSYDSRKLYRPASALFFALKGLRDGHQFLEAAFRAGVRNFVVSDPQFIAVQWLEERGLISANIILVEDTLSAIQDLAAFHRSTFEYPVIAITGSNGKTIVKDWLYQLLSPERKIIRSPKSFNSQLGVALSLWQMDAAHDLAIIEAGISQTGEMARLSAIIRPDIAVLTTMGPAHDSGFASLAEKAAEKLLLFRPAHQLVFPAQKLLNIEWSPAANQETWSWDTTASGSDLDPAVYAIQVEPVGAEGDRSDRRGWTRISARVRNREGVQDIVIPFSDKASVENALTCWTVMLMFGYEQETIRERMENLQVMEMRLEMKQGISGSSVIDDSYSNDLSSLRIALDLLNQQHQHPLKTLILSDFPELPGESEAQGRLYEEVKNLLQDQPALRLLTVGPALAARAGTLPVEEHLAFQSTEELLKALPKMAWNNQTILLKGARKFTFERISAKLVAKTHRTVMEINMSAMAHNISQFKQLIDPDVKLMVMVKAFSYGSGTFEIANLLQFHGVDYLTVAYADEGVELRQAGISLPIMVMSPDSSSFETMYRHHLEPELFSFSILKQWCDWLAGSGSAHYPVHLKFDTGMHRLGFAEADLDQLVATLQGTDQIRIQSVFSHLAASGNPTHDDYTRQQTDQFQRIAAQLEQRLGYSFIKHLANTDGISRFPSAHFDMVRLGLGLYGLDSGSGLDLWPVMQLKTTITQIRQLAAGETVGYGRKGVLSRDSRIATVQIGYADGYDRRFGNGVGYMHVQNHKTPTIGDICMDMSMLDITDFPGIAEGDEVLVYGDVDQLAKRIDTIPYELLVNISQRVKRVYYYG